MSKKSNVPIKDYTDIELSSISGGKVNWGSVAGNCAGGAVIGAFGGITGIISGCLIGGGSTFFDNL
ncbi:class IIb bacteriocin, lactobin A/cerein 7B family [Streptococcus hyointestinalis]|uniref:class IIb bacteriocin, lactobin A/cerein 7B family n=1 Tax=Streptococcus hyointestinalis TaxID=1337 RepID=UPI0023EFA7E8|nr:class IIb bacteriocin, lactobin A/cerein 7B family [Streptococcus hyointestinalis]MCI6871767.1 class IIb bacteriocin, lactobin A/cerein 7B family [Streptococcus hyointestinalis]